MKLWFDYGGLVVTEICGTIVAKDLRGMGLRGHATLFWLMTTLLVFKVFMETYGGGFLACGCRELVDEIYEEAVNKVNEVRATADKVIASSIKHQERASAVMEMIEFISHQDPLTEEIRVCIKKQDMVRGKTFGEILKIAMERQFDASVKPASEPTGAGSS
jgi:hypothetical protein